MKRPMSSWKYEAGILTIAHAGRTFDLGYFGSRDDARNAALAFFEKAAPAEEGAAVARP